MGIAMFYQLTRSGPEAILRQLMGQALERGWRLMIRSPNLETLRRLDARLWAEPEESFLPHAIEGGPHDRSQPVLLGQGTPSNGAQGIFLLDGAMADLDEARKMERIWVLFDGSNEGDLGAARTLWRQMSAADLPAQYWAQSSGRWEKKHESGGAPKKEAAPTGNQEGDQ